MSRQYGVLSQPGSRRGYSIVCQSCGTVKTFKGQDMGERLASEQIPKKLRAAGWDVGRRDGEDTCPDCVDKQRKSRQRAALTVVPPQEETPTMTVSTPKLVAETPRDMTRDERRLIFGKLDEVFLDEKRGYDDGWSDKRVADDLGVPRAWVAKIRDENFGPVNTSPEAAALVKEAKHLLAKADEIMAKADTLAREAQRLVEETKDVARRAAAVERLF